MRSVIILSIILMSCKTKPDGKDNKGWFVYEDVCVRSHQQNSTRIQMAGKTPILVPYTYTVCDESITIKTYPEINKLDTLK